MYILCFIEKMICFAFQKQSQYAIHYMCCVHATPSITIMFQYIGIINYYSIYHSFEWSDTADNDQDQSDADDEDVIIPRFDQERFYSII